MYFPHSLIPLTTQYMRVSFCTNLLQVFLCELFVRICYPSFHCAQCHPKDFGLLHCLLLGKVRGKHLEELLLDHITPISPTGVASNSPSEFCALNCRTRKLLLIIPSFPCKSVLVRGSPSITCLYTLHSTPSIRKIAKKMQFPCILQKKVVIL